MLSKTDMISYYKGNSIPNSHIHMFDPENVNIACNIFKDLIKYAKGKFFFLWFWLRVRSRGPRNYWLKDY